MVVSVSSGMRLTGSVQDVSASQTSMFSITTTASCKPKHRTCSLSISLDHRSGDYNYNSYPISFRVKSTGLIDSIAPDRTSSFSTSCYTLITYHKDDLVILLARSVLLTTRLDHLLFI